MWARLRGVLARVGRWFLSPAGRAVWVRLLLFGASIPLAPYMVAVWRVAPYGQGAGAVSPVRRRGGRAPVQGRLASPACAARRPRRGPAVRTGSGAEARPSGPEPGASPLSRPRNRSSRLISSSSSRMRFLLSSMARVMSARSGGRPGAPCRSGRTVRAVCPRLAPAGSGAARSRCPRAGRTVGSPWVRRPGGRPR